MEKKMWNMDKISQGELEKRQTEYIREALEMAKRAGVVSKSTGILHKEKVKTPPAQATPVSENIPNKSTGNISSDMESASKKQININLSPEINIDVRKKEIKDNTLNVITDNSDKKISITPGKIAFMDESQNMTELESASSLEKIVEEKIAKTEKQDEQMRFGGLSELRVVIERELVASERDLDEKAQALYDIKTVIENEIEMLNRERKGAKPELEKTLTEQKLIAEELPECQEELIDVRKSKEKAMTEKAHDHHHHHPHHHPHDCCEEEDLIEVTSASAAEAVSGVYKCPPDFDEFITRHNERVDSQKSECGCEKCRARSDSRFKKN